MCRYSSDMWESNDWCHLTFWPWIIPTWQVLCQMAYQSKLATWQLSVLSLLSLAIHPWDNWPAISQTHSLSCCPAQLAKSRRGAKRNTNGAFPLAATRLGSTWFLRLVVPNADVLFQCRLKCWRSWTEKVTAHDESWERLLHKNQTWH